MILRTTIAEPTQHSLSVLHLGRPVDSLLFFFIDSPLFVFDGQIDVASNMSAGHVGNQSAETTPDGATHLPGPLTSLSAHSESSRTADRVSESLIFLSLVLSRY